MIENSSFKLSPQELAAAGYITGKDNSANESFKLTPAELKAAGYEPESYWGDVKQGFQTGLNQIHSFADLLRSGLLGFGGAGSRLFNMLSNTHIAPKESQQAAALGWHEPQTLAQHIAHGAGEVPLIAALAEGGGAALGELGVEGALNAIPSMAASNALINASEQPNNKGIAALEGAATGAAGGATGYIGGKAAEALARYFRPSYLKSLASYVKEKVFPTENETAFDKMTANYQNAKNTEEQAWNDLVKESRKKGNTVFDDTDYKNYLEKLHDKIIKDARGQTHLEQRISPTTHQIQMLYTSPVESMEDAIAHRKAINSIIGSLKQGGISTISDPASKYLSKIVHFGLGKNYPGIAAKFDQEILSNLGDMKDTDRLASLWNNANKATQRVKQFQFTRNNVGEMKPTNFHKLYSKGASPKEANAFMEDFTNNKYPNDVKFKELESLIGDKKYTQELLKSNLFSKVSSPEGLDFNTFNKIYNDLGNSKRNYLFLPFQQKDIQDLMTLVKRSHNLDDSTKNKIPAFLHHMGYLGLLHSPGAALGGYLGYEGAKREDLPEWLGLVVGGGAGALAQNSAMKMLASIAEKNPALKDRIIQNALNNKLKISPTATVRRSILPSEIDQGMGERQNGNQ